MSVDTPAADLFIESPFRLSMLLRYGLHRAGHLRCLLRRGTSSSRVGPDDEHLAAAASWLGRAQDATPDGGVVGRYGLAGGWTSSYPETTGYIIPTFIALSDALDPAYAERAERCVRFLLSIQHPDGAFPAGEIAANRTEPSAFNTAQILHGLFGWHIHSGDPASLDAARRAADWLVGLQDADGAWRRSVYGDAPATHTAHLSCWLAELGAQLDETRYRDAASRHLDWVMGHHDAQTGWFDRCDFDDADHEARVGTTHVIGYTLWGVLASGLALGRDDAVAAVTRAAESLAGAFERHGWIAGVLDWRWRPRTDSACLTGNAQLALVWLRIHELGGDARMLEAASRAIDIVKRSQLTDVAAADLHGAVPGSDPIWGSYIRGGCPNWAAKFLIDALLARRRVTAGS